MASTARFVHIIKIQVLAEREEKIQTEVKEIRKVFYCDLCNKQYKLAMEFEAHLSSYDHNHRKVGNFAFTHKYSLSSKIVILLYFLFEVASNLKHCWMRLQRFKEMREMHGSSSRDDRNKREQQREEREMAKFAQMYLPFLTFFFSLSITSFVIPF